MIDTDLKNSVDSHGVQRRYPAQQAYVITLNAVNKKADVGFIVSQHNSLVLS
jgi:hypothetical protein